MVVLSSGARCAWQLGRRSCGGGFGSEHYYYLLIGWIGPASARMIVAVAVVVVVIVGGGVGECGGCKVEDEDCCELLCEPPRLVACGSSLLRSSPGSG